MTDTQATLDLTQGVTAEQFQAALQMLWETARNTRFTSDRFASIMRRTSHRFPETARSTTVPAVKDDDALNQEWCTEEGWTAYQAAKASARARELTQIRGRILRSANDGYLTLEAANALLAAAGLAGYTAPVKDTVTMQIFPGELRVEFPEGTTRTAARDQLRQIFVDAGYNPQASYFDIYQLNPDNRVPESELALYV